MFSIILNKIARFKYSVVDEVQVTKYGLIGAMIKHFDDKV